MTLGAERATIVGHQVPNLSFSWNGAGAASVVATAKSLQFWLVLRGVHEICSCSAAPRGCSPPNRCADFCCFLPASFEGLVRWGGLREGRSHCRDANCDCHYSPQPSSSLPCIERASSSVATDEYCR